MTPRKQVKRRSKHLLAIRKPPAADRWFAGLYLGRPVIIPVRVHTEKFLLFSLFAILILLIGGCNPSPSSTEAFTAQILINTETPTSPSPSQTPTSRPVQSTPATGEEELSPSFTTLTPTITQKPPTATATKKAATATVRPTLGPNDWKTLPTIPEPSSRVAEIYQHGLELGNNPNAFSKIGDCGSTPAWFLGDFDHDASFYNLGEHTSLEEIIQVFQGSFSRTSLAARSGFNASSLFVTLWSDRQYCNSDETPLACEYRVHKPTFAFIMLGTNDIYHPDDFEPQMREIIEFSIDNGVVPILSTKADNMEGDGSINTIIARLALEYDIPLWNFWLAVQPLPDHGLQTDNAHLTWGRNFFNDPVAMQKAWPVRNLNALQILDVVWRAAIGEN